jgi:hypothetical protein
MSQTSSRRISSSVLRYKIDDMTLQEIEKELSDVYGVRAPGMNRGHLATLLAEHREDSASQLHEGLSISNPDDMTSEAIMHELFYVYGNYAPYSNREELVKLLIDYREGLVPAFSFPDPSVMTKSEMQNEISIHFKLNRKGLNQMTADFIRTLRQGF